MNNVRSFIKTEAFGGNYDDDDISMCFIRYLYQ